MAEIICGVNSVPGDNYVGVSINELMTTLKDQLNIPDDARVILNGETIESLADRTLQDTDTVEFLQMAGTKG